MQEMSQRTEVLMRAGVLCLLSFALATISGCGRMPAPADRLTPGRDSAVRMSAQALASLPARRVSALLDFDSPEDLTFITSEPAGVVVNDARLARSGRRSLLIPPGTRDVIVKLPSLLSGRSFPADWTLIGAYIHCNQTTTITMSYEVAGRPVISRAVNVGPGAWTPVMLDLAALGASDTREVGTLRLAFDPRSMAGVRIDDVTLVDNHESVVDTSRSADGWRVRRRGLYYVVDAPGRFSFGVPTAQAEQGGWAVADACASRVRFVSSNAPGSLTIYADGRMYWGGEFRAAAQSLADAQEQALQHATPALVSVPEAMGRLNRSTGGDANNDGYNETRGAYQVLAVGPRVELTITPRTSTLARPVLEIVGLPPGNVLVNMDGRLVSGAIRLSGGEVLLELPGRLERPTLVNVRVQ
ncbi:MAG: hypothetical protein QOF78_3051 [Phycisphaerales bacterium]|jgi:hypothetical protein|nr:hypothetical protein [Phycisphaerales bacterium]